jgi:monomeric isocitrate dehydrogenase
VSEAAIIDCTNPTVQIPQIKKGLADMGHGIPDHPDTKLTLEQRVQALEQKNK